MAETSQIINVPRDTTMQSIVSQLQAIASALNIDWNTITGKPSNIAYYGDPVATESVAPIDPYLQASDVVDNFTDGGTDVPLSAECGKLLNSTLATLLSKLFMTRIGILDGSNTVTIPSTATEIRLVEYNPSGGAAFESVDMLISEMPNPYIQVGECWVSVSGRTISSTPATGKVVRVYSR